MKTAIIFQSSHHGNTKKLLDAIAAQNEVDLIDATITKEKSLEEYDLIGFAAGIAFFKYYPSVSKFAQKNLPQGKKVFFIHTAGEPAANQDKGMKTIAQEKNCQCLGTYFCKGFDTFGPFKLVGGIAKGHPNSDEISGAVEFFNKLAAQSVHE